MENIANAQDFHTGKSQFIEETARKMERKYPMGIPGHQLKEASGGRFSPGYMSNLRSLGKGPLYYKTRTGKVMYPVRPFVEWTFGNE
jgi:hypothetical protein